MALREYEMFCQKTIKEMKHCLLICVCIFAYRTTMDSNSEHINQNSADVENSDQLLGLKIQNDQSV